jgi:glycosyltransferase involved in cell wall biosynthesis
MEAVTVVVPTRNRLELLRLTLTSILRQRDVDLSVIVVDDGSTDDTGGLVSSFADRRVSVLRHPVSRGVSASRNEGASQAATAWLAFCDDDDLWSPDKLWRQLAAARETGSDWAYAGCVHVNADLVMQESVPPLTPAAMRDALPRYNAMPAGASNVIVRAEVFRRLGGFDTRLTHLPDWDLWLRLARHGLPACVAEPLVAYRLHAGNASFRTAEMLAELDGFERRHRVTADRSRFHRHLGRLCLRIGRRGEALNHFARAILRLQDGYNHVDVMTDGRLLKEHATDILRRRLNLRPSHRSERRLRAAAARDPNAAWKAQARAWLNELTG